MKTYVELKVPLANSARWLTELKKELHDLPVRWQNGFYHITVAFITEVPEGVDVSMLLAERLGNVEAPLVTFDKLGAFTTFDNGMHMIYLTASDPSNGLVSLIDSIRKDITDAGCDLEQFILHVTLGRLSASVADVNELRNRLSKIDIPPFTIQLKDVQYREFKGDTLDKYKLQ